jgi:hypothetical protein
LIEHCVWSVNAGFNAKRTEWTIENDIENGYIKKEKKPTVEQVFNEKLAAEAVAAAGGPVKIGKCTE